MKRHLVEFMVGLIFFGIGCGAIGFEVLDFDYLNTRNENVEEREETMTYPVDGTIYYFSVHAASINIINEEDKQDITVTISYPNEYMELIYEEKNRIDGKKLNIDFDYGWHHHTGRKAFELFVNDFKNKKLYNYQKTFQPSITIYLSEQNRKYIKINREVD